MAQDQTTHYSMSSMTRCLNAFSSDTVNPSDFPMTGMTLTRLASVRMRTMSSSRRACPVGGMK